MRTLVGMVAVLILTGFTVAADEKIDAKKLIGKWEPEKVEEKGIKLVLEFKDDGKMTISLTFMDETDKGEGTYKVDGNKIETEVALGAGKPKKDTLTIVKLTDKELTLKPSNGKELVLKKAK